MLMPRRGHHHPLRFSQDDPKTRRIMVGTNQKVVCMIRLFNQDCMTAMKSMPDRAYELAIVDPPYNVGADDGNFGRGMSTRNGRCPSPVRTELKRYPNADKVPDREYFDQLFRVSENQIIWGANYYPEYLKHSGWIVWNKHVTSPLSDAELAYQSINKLVKVFDFKWSGFARAAGSFESKYIKTIHPNQKPVTLYEWLLKNYAKPGDKILDTHGGSGSICIACDIMGFDLDFFEIDKDYFTAAKERLERHQRQGKLFS
jgi:site-specific DNA-methyltransferase (adenine-specific)